MVLPSHPVNNMAILLVHINLLRLIIKFNQIYGVPFQFSFYLSDVNKNIDAFVMNGFDLLRSYHKFCDFGFDISLLLSAEWTIFGENCTFCISIS